MRNTATIAAILTATSGSMVLAAGPELDSVEPAIVAPPGPSLWEGGYVGGQIGYGNGDFDLGDVSDGDDGGDGFVGGLTLGYLWSLNNGWYLGPEFQYDSAELEVTDPDTGDSISFDEMGRLKLIAGREMVGGKGLLFGSAGVAYGSLGSVGDVFDGFSGSDTNWLLGLGYDHRIGENWTIGGEYMNHRFDDISVNTLHGRAAFRF